MNLTKGAKGFDMTFHQGDIDFRKAKAAGIDFIIPRAGWGTESEYYGKILRADPKFFENVKQATAAGIEVPGIYYFIYADNVDEVKVNAQEAVRNAGKAGLPKDTIIWCDIEYDTVERAKDHGITLTAEMLRKFAETFCETVEQAGYRTGIYCNKDYIENVYGHDITEKYDIWLADLSGGPDYKCVFQQYNWQGRVDGCNEALDLDEYYGDYATKESGSKDAKEDENMGKPKSKEYVKVALAVLDRRDLEYLNQFPYNCGYYTGSKLRGDCWNMNPKATIWSMYLNDPVSKNYTAGKYYYQEGINASGLKDVGGDYILNNYCEETTFRKMLQAKVAPCMLLINGAHMGAYIGEFERDGKTYNVSEFSPNGYIGGTMRSYVDEYGRRWNYKGGVLLGSWNRCGYLTSFLDYSDWTNAEPEKEPAKEQEIVTPEGEKATISAGTLASQVYAGKWGNNPARKENITKEYGADMYDAAQKIVDTMVSGMNWYKIEIKLAEEILTGAWGNNPNRMNNITAKYGANAYRIAQGFVNSVSEKDYTLEQLKTAYDVAGGILSGYYGNGQDRVKAIVSKFGETVRYLAQSMVNDILK